MEAFGSGATTVGMNRCMPSIVTEFRTLCVILKVAITASLINEFTEEAAGSSKRSTATSRTAQLILPIIEALMWDSE